MKKITFALVMVLSLLLSACGGQNTEPTNTENGSQQPSAQNEPAPAPTSNFPDKPIKLVVPYAAGGGTDIIFRMISQEAEKELGQPIVIQNMPGANATTGSVFVKDADPDGYTILGHYEGIATAQLTGVVDFSFDAFETVAGLTKTPMIATVHSDLGITTVDDFVKYVKENPGKVKWGMTPGQVDHLFIADFMDRFGVTMEEMPLVNYQGSADLAKGVYAGEVKGGMLDISTAKGYYEDGSFTSIGVAYDERLAQFPDFATFKEQGHDMVLDVTRGIFAPKGTPAEVVEILQNAYKKAVENPDIAQKLLENTGSIVNYIPHDEFSAVLAELQTKLEGQAALIK